MTPEGVQFAEEIAELANCRVAKFGGLIFAKQPISENCPDGLPQDMALLLQQNGDLEFIGIPPPLIERAAEIAKVSVPAVPLTSLCAVFEKYGVDRTDVDDGDFERRREEDIQLQMESWCDFGESLRTETDMLHPDGPDLFLESRVDLAE